MNRITELITRVLNSNIASNAMDDFGNNMSYNTMTELYPSRLENYVTPQLASINNILAKMCMPTCMKENITNHQVRQTLINTTSTAKGASIEDSVATAMRNIGRCNSNYYSFSKCIIINTAAKKTTHDPIVQALKDLGYKEHDVKSYMTQHPFHKVDACSIKIDAGTQTLVIITDVYNYELFDMALVACAQVFGLPISDEDLNLYITDPEAYITQLVQLFTKYNVAAKERKMAKAFQIWMDKSKKVDNTLYKLNASKDNYLDGIAAKRRDINNYQEKLDQVLDQIFAFTLADHSLEDKYAPKENYAAYWVKNKGELITGMSAVSTQGRVELDVHTTLDYWDERNYNKLLHATNGDNCFNKVSTRVKKLLHEIFIERTIRVHFITQIKVGRDIIPEATRRLIDPVVYPQNPHMYYYNCWGNNTNAISKALDNQNYAAAVEQTVSALTGLNMTDISVLNRFMEDLTSIYYDYKYLEVVATGEFISPGEYVTAVAAEERKEQALKEEAERVALEEEPRTTIQQAPVTTILPEVPEDVADEAIARQAVADFLHEQAAQQPQPTPVAPEPTVQDEDFDEDEDEPVF